MIHSYVDENGIRRCNGTERTGLRAAATVVLFGTAVAGEGISILTREPVEVSGRRKYGHILPVRFSSAPTRRGRYGPVEEP